MAYDEDIFTRFARELSSKFIDGIDDPNLIPTMIPPKFGEDGYESLPAEPGPSLLDGIKNVGEMAANFAPYGIGDMLSVKDAAEQFGEGNYGWSALSALGALPGIPSLGIFAGKMAKTADLEKLAQAEKLVAEGADASKYVGDTGWFKAPWDDQWRFKVSDEGFDVWPNGDSGKSAYQEGLKGLYLKHPGLREAYPDLDRDLRFRTHPAEGATSAGEYSYPKTDRRSHFIDIYSKNQEVANGSAIHELQHAVQHIEGFGKGGSPEGVTSTVYDAIDKINDELGLARKDLLQSSDRGWADAMAKVSTLDEQKDALLGMLKKPIKTYKRLGGEVEARLAQKELTNPSTNPFDNLDVPMEEIIPNSDYDYSSLIKTLLSRRE